MVESGIEGEAVVPGYHVDLAAEGGDKRLDPFRDGVEVGAGAHGIAAEVDEQQVAGRIERDPCLDRGLKELRPEAHRLGAEETRVHGDGTVDDRGEGHVGEDVAAEVDARGDLDQLQAL